MGHPEVIDDPAIGAESIETWTGDFKSADHGDVVGYREQQRPAIGVAIAQERFDLERWACRICWINDPAVIDDVLEHRQSPDAHQLV
jgi:hypothetical protein